MKTTSLRSLFILCFASLLGSAQAAAPAAVNSDAAMRQATRMAERLASELAQICPVADPGDVAAVNACRQGLYFASEFKTHLPEFLLWGRQADPKAALRDTNLTQFGPDTFTGLYLPLFMFNGKHTVEFVEREGLYRFHLQTAFRNRLPPSQFAYPFWHNADKWTAYQSANEVLVWWDPVKSRIKIMQYTKLGPTPPLLPVQLQDRAFDGKWVWTDENGQTQPKVTLFDGIFEPNNPYLHRIETTYKALALRLREGQCNDCHVPNNPDKAKKLVLLQTPVHAASEIKRLLKVVREDRMPRDEFGLEVPLEHHVKAALLEDGMAFDKALDDARRWEADKGAMFRQARANMLPKLPVPALSDSDAAKPAPARSDKTPAGAKGRSAVKGKPASQE